MSETLKGAVKVKVLRSLFKAGMDLEDALYFNTSVKANPYRILPGPAPFGGDIDRAEFFFKQSRRSKHS